MGPMRTDEVPYMIGRSSLSCTCKGLISSSVVSDSMQRSVAIMAINVGDEGTGVGSLGEKEGRLPDGDMSSQDLNL